MLTVLKAFPNERGGHRHPFISRSLGKIALFDQPIDFGGRGSGFVLASIRGETSPGENRGYFQVSPIRALTEKPVRLLPALADLRRYDSGIVVITPKCEVRIEDPIQVYHMMSEYRRSVLDSQNAYAVIIDHGTLIGHGVSSGEHTTEWAVE